MTQPGVEPKGVLTNTGTHGSTCEGGLSFLRRRSRDLASRLASLNSSSVGSHQPRTFSYSPGVARDGQVCSAPFGPDMFIARIRVVLDNLSRINDFARDVRYDHDPVGRGRHRPTYRRKVVARYGKPVLLSLRCPPLRLRLLFGTIPGLGTLSCSSGSALFAAASMASHRCCRSS